MQLKEILDVILSNRPKDAIDKIWGITVLLKLVFCVVACFVGEFISCVRGTFRSPVWIDQFYQVTLFCNICVY